MKDIFEGLNPQFIDDKSPPKDIFEGLDATFLPEKGASTESNSKESSPEDILKAKGMPQQFAAAYDNFSQLPDDSKKKLFNDIVRVAIKAPLGGAASVLDFISTLPLNAGISAYNTVAPEGYSLPHAKSFEQKSDEFVDYAANKVGLDTSGTGPVTEGVKLATSVATGGGLGKALTSLPKAAASLLGSTNPQVLIGAVGAGAGTEIAKEQGSGIVGQLGSGLAGGAIAESLPFVLNKKSWANGVEKGLINILGLGKKKIKLDALESAEKLGVDLPAAAATNSVITSYANQLISKLPRLGDKLRDKVKKTSDQFQSAWDSMLDSVAPKIDQKLSKEARSIYKIPNNLLKNSEDAVSPEIILDKIKGTKEFLKSPIKSDPTKKVLSYLNELEEALMPQKMDISKQDLPKNFQNFPSHVQEKILNELSSEAPYISIQEVLRSKIEINKIMRDRNVFDRIDTDTLGFLNGVKSSIDATLKEYGVTNPKWYAAFEQAEKKYASLAKRENLEQEFAGKIINPATQEVSYTPLVKMLEDPSKQKFFKNNLGEKNYKKLNDFVNVARSMDNIQRNILNPSSTAIVGGAMGLIHGIVFGTNLVPGVVTVISSIGATKLLTDKRFLNVAKDFAKNPSVPLAKRLDKIVKDRAGVGIRSLMQQTSSNEE